MENVPWFNVAIESFNIGIYRSLEESLFRSKSSNISELFKIWFVNSASECFASDQIIIQISLLKWISRSLTLNVMKKELLIFDSCCKGFFPEIISSLMKQKKTHLIRKTFLLQRTDFYFDNCEGFSELD